MTSRARPVLEGTAVRSVGGREFRVSSPDRVFYPATGTTKADVIEYYLQVAGVMVPHVVGRPATRKRWPGGVGGPDFFAKDLEVGTPAWLTRVQIRHSSGPKFYPVMDSPAAVGWLGQVAALEVHVPQWRIETDLPGVTATSTVRHPDRVVFDLDPGPGAGLGDCVRVALYLRDRLGVLGARCVPVTSGSKGIHVYVPMDDRITGAQALQWARLVAEQIEQAMPGLVVSRMTKALRDNKVLVDWSQNNPKKTTIAPYSLRGRAEPTVAAPRTWEELGAPGLQQLTYQQVLGRLAAGLDPLAVLLQPRAVAAVVGAPPPVSPRPRPSLHLTTPRPAPPRVTPQRQVVPTPEEEPGGPSTPAAPAAGALDWSPMLASPGRLGMLSGGVVWRIEGKWDGMRVIAVVDRGTVVLRSRTGRDVTAGYPELAELPGLLGQRQVVLDGEIVAMDPAGRTDFGRLQQRIGLTRPADIDRIRRSIPVAVLIFDVLAVDGVSLLGHTLDQRRRVLESLPLTGTFCLVPPQLAGDPAELLAQTKVDGWEGIVAKRADSHYLPGQRSPAWLKFKNEHHLQAAVIGWQPGQGRRADTIGSLLMAVPADGGGGGWRYIGKVGTGMSDKTLTELSAALAPLRQDTPAAVVPRPDARTAVWVTPRLVGDVAYSEMTHLGTLRAPRWRGLRTDKTISDLEPTPRDQ